MDKLDTGNLLEGIPRALAQEQFSEIASAPGVRVERIVSTGHATPEGEWYDQDRDEWVMVVKGAARLAFDKGDDLAMGPGDHVLIPAHCRHRVAWTSPDEPTVWLAVHFGSDDEEKSK